MPHRVGLYIFAVLSCLFLALPLPSADAYSKRLRGLPDKDIERAVEFVVGNVLFFMFHEAGHMLISEFDLPVLGNEEDAADSAAVLFMLEADDKLFDTMLADAALGWRLVAKRNGGEDDVDTSAAHRLAEQRAYGIVCMMAGKDPKKYKKIADEYDLPDDRREECEDEYRKIHDSWYGLLAEHVAPDNHHTRFRISYRKPESGALSDTANIFRESEVLEVIQEAFATPFKLKNGIKVTATECGEDNAYWSSDDREITVCYELAQYYTDLFIYHLKNKDK